MAMTEEDIEEMYLTDRRRTAWVDDVRRWAVAPDSVWSTRTANPKQKTL